MAYLVRSPSSDIFKRANTLRGGYLFAGPKSPFLHKNAEPCNEETRQGRNFGGKIDSSLADQAETRTEFIFARLPGESGDSELHQLPFTRFTIKKDSANDEVDSSVARSVSTKPNQTPQESAVTMEERLQQFSQKLDDLNSSIAMLSGSMQTQRCPLTPVRQTPTPINGKSGKRRSPTIVAPDYEFMNRLDETIDRVLRRINKDKEVQTIKEMDTLYNVQLYETLSSTRDELPSAPSNPTIAPVSTPIHRGGHFGLPPNSCEPVNKKRKLNKPFPFSYFSANVDMDHCL
ncbi:unnamed protein product [Dicrocoelium dendriticum]|nr:unnamed protein product [Dicrocoelium dendriticum]